MINVVGYLLVVPSKEESMNKRTLIVGVFFVLAVTLCLNAYAADGAGDVNAWQGFWNSVGGFVYNALPWNWGNWMGH
jgi:hypothetical protein